MQKRRPSSPNVDDSQADQRFFLKAWLGAAAFAALVVAIDQVLKTWAVDNLREKVIHVGDFLDLALVYNKGVAFGLGEGAAPILVAIAIGGMLVVFFAKKIRLTPLAVMGVGLVLGGAFGNVIDRVFRDTGGAVVDFVDFGWWPVFNFADAAIVIGSVLLVIWGSRNTDEREQDHDGGSSEKDAE